MLRVRSASLPIHGDSRGEGPHVRLVWRALYAFLITLVAAIPGHAAFTAIDQPGNIIPGTSSVYMSTAKVITPVAGTSITDGTLSVTFSTEMYIFSMDESGWGASPNTEGGAVSTLYPFTEGFTMTLSEAVRVFGFEAMTNSFGSFTITAAFYHDTTSLGSITRTAGAGYDRAQLFAAAMTSASDLSINKIVITTTDPCGITPLVARFRYIPLAATFSTQPGGASAGSVFGIQPVINFYDLSGNLATAFNGAVTVAIESGTGTSGAVLSGTTTVNAKAGIATFTDLAIDKPGSGYVLHAATSDYPTIASSAFDVAQVATQMAVTTAPAGAVAGSAFGTQPVVTVKDALGNTALNFSGPVTIALKADTGTAGAVLSGTTTVNAVAGVATFTDLSIDKPGTGYVLTATSGTLTPGDSAPFTVIDTPTGPWGDVNQDGFVTLADADLVHTYITDSASLSAEQRERIERYGDINGTQNVSSVGNGIVDVNDLLRIARIAGGILDPGTAGPQYPHYGDVDNDGKVGIADVVLVARYLNGLVTDADTVARITAGGVGDVAPTTQKVTFGDGQITAADEDLIRARATGTEMNPPAYQDYWPAVPNDRYKFTDLNGKSGDALSQTNFLTMDGSNPNGYSFDGRGFTVTDVVGDEGSLAGVYKGINGSVYALYAQVPMMFSNQRIDFQSPMKLLDTTQLAPGSSWSGDVIGNMSIFGMRPVHYKVTVLRVGDTYTNAAGDYPTSSPVFSTWSDTVSVRVDIAVLATSTSPVEMQQAVFFDFAPGIGVVRRGQASVQGSAAPMNDRPLLELDRALVRGVQYPAMPLK